MCVCVCVCVCVTRVCVDACVCVDAYMCVDACVDARQQNYVLRIKMYIWAIFLFSSSRQSAWNLLKN